MSSHILDIFKPIISLWQKSTSEWADEYDAHTLGYRQGYEAGYSSESSMVKIELIINRDRPGAAQYILAYAKGYAIGLDDQKKGRAHAFLDEEVDTVMKLQ